MRRRRKTRYTWFPSDGGTLTDGQKTEELIAFSANIPITTSNQFTNGFVTSVIADFGRTDEDSKNNSLADIMGSEYLLKRIVGKLFVEATVQKVGADANFAPDDLNSFLVTAGFFIAPYGTDPATGAIAEDFPVGQTGSAMVSSYNPMDGFTARQPWIWRRTWLLTAGGHVGMWAATPGAGAGEGLGLALANGQVVGGGTFPSNNVAYGSVLDGPHIDAKTARRVHKHERLWYAVAAAPWPEGATVDPDEWQDAEIRTVLDARVLGALRKARNRSSFE